MPRGKDINVLLSALADKPIQAYFGQGLHTLGLLSWILRHTGQADVWVSSYSTSEAFLNGFVLLKQRGLIRHSMLLLDQRAARKTLKLETLLDSSFEHVFLGQNHSKVLLVHNGRFCVSVVTSQNQTYGSRSESTIITTDSGVFDTLLQQYVDTAGSDSVEIDLENGKGIITENQGAGKPSVNTGTDWRPFGTEE